MSRLTIELDKALSLRDRGALLVDVRTPAEFAEATIPGALNVPLFSNNERAMVGTVYKHQGRNAARQLGVELVSPRIPEMLARVSESRKERSSPVIVFCWRGGMRSRALTTFLDLAGIPALQLEGGHKAFRAGVRDFLAMGRWGRLLVLRGLTGVGKTRQLHRLRAEGYPVIDLEGLANHRGSAFGGIGLNDQPSQKMFESLLWDELRKIPETGYALAEGESRHIGRRVLPPRLYADLQKETTLWLDASLDYRVGIILDDYPASDRLREVFQRPIEGLKPRLGKKAVEGMLDLLRRGCWEELVRDLMVLYYDPLYNHTKPQHRIEIDIEEDAGQLHCAIDLLVAGGLQSDRHPIPE